MATLLHCCLSFGLLLYSVVTLATEAKSGWVVDNSFRIDARVRDKQIAVSWRKLVAAPETDMPEDWDNPQIFVSVNGIALESERELDVAGDELPYSITVMSLDQYGVGANEGLREFFANLSTEESITWMIPNSEFAILQTGDSANAYVELVTNGLDSGYHDEQIMSIVLDEMLRSGGVRRAIVFPFSWLIEFSKAWFDRAFASGVTLYPVFTQGDLVAPEHISLVGNSGGRFLPWIDFPPSLLEAALAILELKSGNLARYQHPFNYRLPFEAPPLLQVTLTSDESTTNLKLQLEVPDAGLLQLINPASWIEWGAVPGRRVYAFGVLVAVATLIVVAYMLLRQRAPLATIREIGGNLHKVYQLPYVIGRGESCDLTINNLRVSREHVSLVQMQGGIAVRDMGSHNGTFINSAKIEEGRLSRQQILLLGGVELEVTLIA